MITFKEQRVIAKYLADYAEPEARVITRMALSQTFDCALVLPCYDEPIDKVQQLLSQKTSSRVLFIIIVNAPQNAAPSPLNATKQLYTGLNSLPPLRPEMTVTDLQVKVGCEFGVLNDVTMVGSLSLKSIPNSHNAALLVDRVNVARIPHKEGVGLARKIGADIALQLYLLGTISNQWVGSTDADAKLPSGYFGVLQTLHDSREKYAGAVFGFKHSCTDQRLQQASVLYDLALRYYVDALSWSGSPYAFATIGSCLAFNLVAYAQVRGFPKRAAGEDFYLLNKLCKLKLSVDSIHAGADFGQRKSSISSGILSVNQTVIVLEARESHRVPFGTGPAITKILTDANPVNSYLFYHPRIFGLLRLWISMMARMWSEIASTSDKSLDSCWWQCLDTFIVNTSQTVSTSESSIVLTEKEIGVLKSWSAESGWFDALRHCHRQASSEGAFAVQLHTWFDGFRTLKFVHYMRQHLYASLPAYDLLKEHGKVQQEFDDAVLAKFEKRLYDSAAHVSD